jgi:hypothetical protein
MIGDVVVVMVEVVDDHRAGEGHQCNHHPDTCLRGHQRREHAGAAKDRPESRCLGGQLGALVPQECGDLLRIGAHRGDQREAHQLETGRHKPQRGEHVAVEVATGGQRTEDSGPEDRPENCAEQHEADAPRPALWRVHVSARRPHEQVGTVGGAHADRADQHRRC